MARRKGRTGRRRSSSRGRRSKSINRYTVSRGGIRL